MTRAALAGSQIDNACVVFVGLRFDGSLFLTEDHGERAVVLESEYDGSQQILTIAPDATDSIEYVRIDPKGEYVVEVP